MIDRKNIPDDPRSPSLSKQEIEDMIKAERQRIPMSTPTLKLHVPEIPGYRTYWFNDDPGRISRALRAGYTFVTEDEIDLNVTTTVCESALGNGNTDLGSNISLTVDRSTGQRAYLMKIKTEHYLQDQADLEQVNARVDRTISRGQIGADGDLAVDRDKRYSSSDYQPLRKRSDR